MLCDDMPKRETLCALIISGFTSKLQGKLTGYDLSCTACLLLWCRALLACMQPLERIFKDADNVALSSLVSTVQIPAGPGPATQASQAKTAAVSMFDDDLDVGAPVAAASGANRSDAPSWCPMMPNMIPSCFFMSPDPRGNAPPADAPLMPLIMLLMPSC